MKRKSDLRNLIDTDVNLSKYLSQGAIPKNKGHENKNKFSSNESTKSSEKNSQFSRNKENHHSRIKKWSSLSNFDKRSNDHPIILNSKPNRGPFVYIVPNNPSSGYSLAPGKYLIISLSETDILNTYSVIRHPKKGARGTSPPETNNSKLNLNSSIEEEYDPLPSNNLNLSTKGEGLKEGEKKFDELIDKYINDENGLNDYIKLEKITGEILEMMASISLNLPENYLNSLKMKYMELNENKELMLKYLEKIKIKMEKEELLLKVLDIFPNIDPSYVKEKLENFNYGGGEKYPINEDLSNDENKKLWKMYVNDFDMDDFMIEFPNYKNYYGSIAVLISYHKEINDYERGKKKREDEEREEAESTGFFYCTLCCDDKLIFSLITICPDGLIICVIMKFTYINIKIGDGANKFYCPCGSDTILPDDLIKNYLCKRIFKKLLLKRQAEEIKKAQINGLESCLFCHFSYIPNPDDKVFICQNEECLKEICRNCHEENHIPLKCEEVIREKDIEARKKIEEEMTKKLLRTCPNCGQKFIKIDGCNKITCTCGTLACYICQKQIQDYTHFSDRGGIG
ncbi:E3 ubiquitin ligase triad3, putative [Pediculus humanus corporis]|uniref:E3 ubiquitin ligase triad3, putative n=1 Tax=Pediculus humanus subsp. corporis TaxID=121224 RepID=E0VXW8_PEDHC|nr:E3 ubiquitin ligase triad3, putative [Pediculus humanus corporis]EEB18224.1 E3 ubiquitin ligase triad3, putative [Pediculus humanus corporis]